MDKILNILKVKVYSKANNFERCDLLLWLVKCGWYNFDHEKTNSSNPFQIGKSDGEVRPMLQDSFEFTKIDYVTNTGATNV